MTKLNITVKDDNSPYQFQGAYEKTTFCSPVDFSNNTVAPDIENSYIQQNLPVRRQSLIVYHDKMRNENECHHKRHTSLILPSTANDKLRLNTRLLSNSKSLDNVVNHQPQPLQPLTIQISQQHSDSNVTASPTTSHSSGSGSGTDFSMDTLFEEGSTMLPTQRQQQPQKSPPKLIGLLRPSKSDTSNMYKKTKIRQLKSQDDLQQQQQNENIATTSPLSQSWNDMTHQPLSKLKSVFSRLQPNNNEVNVLPSISTPPVNTAVKSRRNESKHNSIVKACYSEEVPKKKKSKKSVVILDLPPAERKKKNSRKEQQKQQQNHACMIYTALLSHVAREFLKTTDLTTITFKDGIEYEDVFSGLVAVNCLLDILNTNDRNLALLVGRALENQGLFHHINYDYKLRDSESEIYQFQHTHHHRYYQQEDNNCKRSPIPNQFIITSPLTPKPLKRDNHNNIKQAPLEVCATLPVHGVFSLLTDCYSPTCTRKTPCYSISCPRMVAQKDKDIRRPLSTHFLKSEQEQLRSLWRHSVPLDIVLGTNNIEQKRQECIYELIYTEEDFTKDMHYVQDFWIEPILNSDIIPVERRNEFITDVFWNLSDIVRISSALTKDLTARQDKHSVIPKIGDIMLNHVQEFQPFVMYGAHQIIGRHIYELEKKRNQKFLQFVEKMERQPESRRLELNGYLTKPTSRLGRYNLLLNTIHQLTPKDHQDYKDIPKVMDMITELLVQLDKKVGYSDNKFHLKQISSKIIPANKGSSHINTVNLDLLNPKRQLLMRGKMKRCIHHQNHSIIDHTHDMQVFLFDHYLVICKIKIQDGLEHYKLYQKPIPLSSLSVSIPNTVIIPSPTPTRKSSSIYNKISSNSFHTIPSSLTTTNTTLLGFPITFHQKYTAIDAPFSITLATTTESTRKLWLDKINELPGDINQDFVIRINHNTNKK